jgi:prophage DNA circulation protein
MLANGEIAGDPAQEVAQAIRATGDAIPAETVDGALAALLEWEDQSASGLAEAARVGALLAMAEALPRRVFSDRPMGVQARALFAERFAAAMQRASVEERPDLFVALSDISGRVAEYLARIITDLAPVVTVSAPRRMPSLWWAWRLYADPARAAEIVARNRLAHPSFVPRQFEALAP